MDETWRIADPVTQVELRVPHYATPESTIRRAARERDGLIEELRFFPEWGHEWPLWRDDGPVNPDQLGLTQTLSDAIHRWIRRWESMFRIDTGWPTTAESEAWLIDGDAIANRLQEEVWEFAEVRASHRGYSRTTASGV